MDGCGSHQTSIPDSLSFDVGIRGKNGAPSRVKRKGHPISSFFLSLSLLTTRRGKNEEEVAFFTHACTDVSLSSPPPRPHFLFFSPSP